MPWAAEKLKPDWFVSLGAISDTLVELRRLPTPVGAADLDPRQRASTSSARASRRSSPRRSSSSLALIKGNTTFKPPDYEFRIVPAFNVQPRRGRGDPRAARRSAPGHHAQRQPRGAAGSLRRRAPAQRLGPLRLRLDPRRHPAVHLGLPRLPLPGRARSACASSARATTTSGSTTSAWFRRLEKDTNSGLNDVTTRAARATTTFVANALPPGLPVARLHLAGAPSVLNVQPRGRRGDFFDDNGFLERPAVLGDARAARLHASPTSATAATATFGALEPPTSVYLALGRDERHPLAQQRAGHPRRLRRRRALARLQLGARAPVRAVRSRATRIPSTGRPRASTRSSRTRSSPAPTRASGSARPIPLIGGGGVALSGRNGVLASLRSSKDQGQSNFVNPGLLLLGVGADVDLTPQLRAIGNVNVPALRGHDGARRAAQPGAAIDARSAGTSPARSSGGPFMTPERRAQRLRRGAAARQGPEAALRRGQARAAVLRCSLNLLLTF